MGSHDSEEEPPPPGWRPSPPSTPTSAPTPTSIPTTAAAPGRRTTAPFVVEEEAPPPGWSPSAPSTPYAAPLPSTMPTPSYRSAAVEEEPPPPGWSPSPPSNPNYAAPTYAAPTQVAQAYAAPAYVAPAYVAPAYGAPAQAPSAPFVPPPAEPLAPDEIVPTHAFRKFKVPPGFGPKASTKESAPPREPAPEGGYPPSAMPVLKEVVFDEDVARELVREVEARGFWGQLAVASIVLLVLAGALGTYGFVAGWDKVAAFVQGDDAAAARRQAAVDAKAKLVEGLKAYADKKYDVAIDVLGEAVRLDPGLAEAYRNLGVVLALQKRNAEAATFYEKYLELSPTAPDAAEVRAIVDAYNKKKR